jgi:hypothetical protein
VRFKTKRKEGVALDTVMNPVHSEDIDRYLIYTLPWPIPSFRFRGRCGLPLSSRQCSRKVNDLAMINKLSGVVSFQSPTNNMDLRRGSARNK